MTKKHMRINRILKYKFQLILISIVILSIIFSILSLNRIYKGEIEVIESNLSLINYSSIVSLDNNITEDKVKSEKITITAFQKPQDAVFFQYLNKDLKNLSEKEFANLSVANLSSGNPIFKDSLNNTAYILATKNIFEYNILKISNDFNIENKFLFKHKLPELIEKEYYETKIEKEKIRFYKPLIIDKEKSEKDSSSTVSKFSIKKINDGIRLTVTHDFFLNNIARSLPLSETDFEQEFLTLQYLIKKETNIKLPFSEIYKSFSFFNMKNFWDETLKKKKNRFQMAEVVGLLDSDDNGEKELIIHFQGTRYINSKLICFDFIKGKVIWEKEFANIISNFQIIDIDNDNKDEILFQSYSPFDQNDFDYYKKHKETGLSYFGYFRILTNKGNNKEINGKKVFHKFNKKITFSSGTYVYLNNQNKIMLLPVGSKSKNMPDRYALLLDLKTNEIDTTKIRYKKIRKAFIDENDNNNIVLIDDLWEGTEKISISNKDEIKVINRIKNNKINKARPTKNFRIKISGDECYLFNPFIITDKNLNIVYQNKHKIDYGSNFTISNTLIFLNSKVSNIEGNRKELIIINFKKSYKLCHLKTVFLFL